MNSQQLTPVPPPRDPPRDCLDLFPGVSHLPLMPLSSIPSLTEYFYAEGRFPQSHCRRCTRRGFSPWVGKIPWRRKWQPTLVFLPGESMDRGAWRARVHGVSKSQTGLKWLSMHTAFCRHSIYSTIYLFIFEWLARLSASVLSCSVVSQAFVTPWTVARQAPLSMEFSR